jgi:putative acyl-CoA dehydrogenase
MRRVRTLLAAVPKPLATHDITNQVPLLENYNALASNACLRDCLAAFAPAATPQQVAALHAFGATVGDAEWMATAKAANENPPVFKAFDRQGRRTDGIAFHPAYHQLMKHALDNGVAAMAWRGGDSAQALRAVACMLYSQLEQGTQCPVTMTFAATPVLRRWNAGGVFDEWCAKLLGGYDAADAHISALKGVTIGMSMTEAAGGSDVSRAVATTAVRMAPEDFPAGAEAECGLHDAKGGGAWALRGAKWFTSAPMCNGFLTLARTEQGVSCFLVPRWLSPTARNTGLRFQQLKSKLGDRSNASSEVEYHGAVGYLVGAEGRGVPTIIDMVNHTRLDCLLGSAALMQVSVTHACHHANHREAFGARLIEKPLMRAVLCDIALEAEGATALALRVASAFEARHAGCAHEQGLKRLATAIGKYYVTKRCTSVVHEALEVHGGNGYVEDFPMARYYRQAPLNAVWEGSGNVIVLDVFRGMAKDAAALQAVQDEVARAADDRLSAMLRGCLGELRAATKAGEAELAGRRIVEPLAVLLQAAALRAAKVPDVVYESFVASRVTDSGRRLTQYGTLPASCVHDAIIQRYLPPQ